MRLGGKGQGGGSGPSSHPSRHSAGVRLLQSQPGVQVLLEHLVPHPAAAQGLRQGWMIQASGQTLSSVACSHPTLPQVRRCVHTGPLLGHSLDHVQEKLLLGLFLATVLEPLLHLLEREEEFTEKGRLVPIQRRSGQETDQEGGMGVREGLDHTVWEQFGGQRRPEGVMGQREEGREPHSEQRSWRCTFTSILDPIHQDFRVKSKEFGGSSMEDVSSKDLDCEVSNFESLKKKLFWGLGV